MRAILDSHAKRRAKRKGGRLLDFLVEASRLAPHNVHDGDRRTAAEVGIPESDQLPAVAIGPRGRKRPVEPEDYALQGRWSE